MCLVVVFVNYRFRLRSNHCAAYADIDCSNSHFKRTQRSIY